VFTLDGSHVGGLSGCGGLDERCILEQWRGSKRKRRTVCAVVHSRLVTGRGAYWVSSPGPQAGKKRKHSSAPVSWKIVPSKEAAV
jgi:hypothetical protein